MSPTTDPELKFAVQLAYKRLTDSISKDYLPLLLQSIPSLNPYQLSNWDLGNIGGKNTPIEMKLSDLTMTGLTNALPDQPEVTDETVVVTLILSTTSVGDPEVKIVGNFNCTIDKNQSFSGNITVIIGGSNATISTTISTENDKFKTAVNSVIYAVPDYSKMSVTLNFSEGKGSSWEELINKQINKNLPTIVQKANDDFKCEKNRKTIATIITNELNKL